MKSLEVPAGRRAFIKLFLSNIWLLFLSDVENKVKVFDLRRLYNYYIFM